MVRKTFDQQFEALLEFLPSDAYIGVTELAAKADMDARIVRRVLKTAIKLQYNKVKEKRIGKRTVYTVELRGRPITKDREKP